MSSVSVPSNRSYNFVCDSASSFGFGFFCCNSRSSIRIRICIGVWSLVLPGVSGVGNQKVLFSGCGLLVLSSSVR